MKPTALGVYVYAGGFTQGVKQRFSVDRHLEDEKPYGAAVAMLNHGVEVHPYGEWDDAYGSGYDVTVSNPPCAPFSNSGMRLGSTAGKWEADPRMSCHSRAVAAGRKAGSEIIVLESVQAAQSRGGAFYEALTPPGMALTYLEHDAARLGVPQRRRRTFVVYHSLRLDLAPLALDLRDTVLSAKTWAGLPDPGEPTGRKKTQPLIRYTKPGEKILEGWKRAGEPRPGVPSAISRRLAWGQVAPTMAGTYGYAHPDLDRWVGLAEFRRLCGFPDDYNLGNASTTEKVLLMVRGVMPPVASRLADALRGSLQERPVTVTQSKKVRTVNL